MTERTAKCKCNGKAKGECKCKCRIEIQSGVHNFRFIFAYSFGMGSNWASELRELREREMEVCCVCGLDLPVTGDGTFRSLAEKRYCAGCKARSCLVLCNVMHKGDYSVHFMDADFRTRIGPWLLFDTEAEIEPIIAWGHPSPADLKNHRDVMESTGRSSLELHLTWRERALLVERGRGCPWNGFELWRRKAGVRD